LNKKKRHAEIQNKILTRGRPSAKPKNTKTTCLLTQNYRDFFESALASKIWSVLNKLKNEVEQIQKMKKGFRNGSEGEPTGAGAVPSPPPPKKTRKSQPKVKQKALTNESKKHPKIL
jgi:hypothetical protein